MSYAGQPGSPWAANDVQAARIAADTASASGERRVADQHRRLAAVEVAEDERYVEAVAGTEGAAHARSRPGQLVDVRPAAAGRLGLGEVERRHPEQPVGVDQLVELLRAGRREGLAVAAAPSGPGANTSRALAACSSSPAPSSPLMTVNRRCSSRVWPTRSSTSRAGAVGQGLPRCRRQDLAVDDGREGDPPVRGPAPAVRPLLHRGADRVSGGGQPAWGDADRSATVGRSPSSAAQAAAMSAASSGEKKVPGMLCTTARRKSPAARSIASSAATDPPPADWPKTVTRSGSPPKARDVVAHPLQSGDLVEQARGWRGPPRAARSPRSRPGS